MQNEQILAEKNPQKSQIPIWFTTFRVAEDHRYLHIFYRYMQLMTESIFTGLQSLSAIAIGRGNVFILNHKSTYYSNLGEWTQQHSSSWICHQLGAVLPRQKAEDWGFGHLWCRQPLLSLLEAKTTGVKGHQGMVNNNAPHPLTWNLERRNEEMAKFEMFCWARESIFNIELTCPPRAPSEHMTT